jgi:hypothetical protein
MPDLSDDCTSGVLDLDRGQGFFSFYDSSTALLLSVNLPQRLTPTYAPVLANNPQMVGSCILFLSLDPFLVIIFNCTRYLPTKSIALPGVQ